MAEVRPTVSQKVIEHLGAEILKAYLRRKPYLTFRRSLPQVGADQKGKVAKEI